MESNQFSTLEHNVGTTAFGGGGFTVWGCFSLNCKFDLYVIDGTLRGLKYRDQILRSLVVPSLPQPDIPSHMVTCPLKPGSFVAYCQ
jgi:hypothetical protein